MELTGLETLIDLICNLKEDSLFTQDDTGNGIIVEFEMNKPASEEKILEVEKEMQFKFPCSYREFLLNFDGGRIYDYEGLDGFKLFGTEDIKLINKEVASSYEEYWINDILIFCEIIGEGNYLGFDRRNNEYKVLDCFHEELPQSWLVISEDFDKWLELLVLNEGAKFWLY